MPWCVLPWVQLLWESLSFLDFLEIYFLCQTGDILLHYFFKYVFNFLLLSSSSGTPMIWILECLKLSQKFLSLSSLFLNSCFFILFWLNVYFSLLLQIIDLSPGVLPFTVGSLYIFLYFTQHSLHFFI